MLLKVENFKKTIECERKQNFYIKSKFNLVSSLKKKLSDVIFEQSNRGDVSAICSSLHKAYSNGLLNEKSKLLMFIKTIASNATKQPKGRRYDKFTEMLYQGMRIVGGPRCANLMAKNLCGPADGSLKRYWRKSRFDFRLGITKDFFCHLNSVYKRLIEEHKIHTPLLVEQAEDETVIIKMLEWIRDKDLIVGSCGPIGPNHRCQANYTMKVGNDEQSYDRLKLFFEQSIVSHMARVVMINPLHPLLPSAVVFLMPT